MDAIAPPRTMLQIGLAPRATGAAVSVILGAGKTPHEGASARHVHSAVVIDLIRSTDTERANWPRCRHAVRRDYDTMIEQGSVRELIGLTMRKYLDLGVRDCRRGRPGALPLPPEHLRRRCTSCARPAIAAGEAVEAQDRNAAAGVPGGRYPGEAPGLGPDSRVVDRGTELKSLEPGSRHQSNIQIFRWRRHLAGALDPLARGTSCHARSMPARALPRSGRRQRGRLLHRVGQLMGEQPSPGARRRGITPFAKDDVRAHRVGLRVDQARRREAAPPWWIRTRAKSWPKRGSK